MYAVYRDGERNGIVEIKLVDGGRPLTQFGQIFHSFRCEGTNRCLSDIQVDFYGVLLPNHDRQSDLNANLYTVLTDKWRVMDQCGNVVLPHMYLDISVQHWQD